MRVHHGENRRLLINQPPRSLKSLCISIAMLPGCSATTPIAASSS
jgi:hypothetical protein